MIVQIKNRIKDAILCYAAYDIALPMIPVILDVSGLCIKT